jgi:hypothetical protein
VQDFGLYQAVAQRQSVTPVLLSEIFWAALAIGALAALAVAALGPFGGMGLRGPADRPSQLGALRRPAAGRDLLRPARADGTTARVLAACLVDVAAAAVGLGASVTGALLAPGTLRWHSARSAPRAPPWP